MLKDIPVIRGRQYIASLVAEGEHGQQDFKFLISDARKIARSVSAFANTDGGHLLIGVKDNGVIAGVRNDEDIYVVEQAATRYCRPAVQVEFTAFRVDNGVIVIRATIPAVDQRPIECQDHDGTWHSYVRVADENIAAHHLMVRGWKNPPSGPVAYDSTMRAVLAFVAEHPEGVDTADVARGCGLSTRRTESLLLNLLHLDLIKFRYHAPHFLLSANNPK